MDVAELAARVRRREPGAVARALTLVENGGEQGIALLEALGGPKAEGPPRIGLAGPPGAGKSTLADRMLACWRGTGRTVALLAVDPTSPFSGGALLGDRVRLRSETADGGLFVRSVASRGAAGGLAGAIVEMADVLEAAGFERILIETVGVGQNELEIAGAADLVTVVVQPQTGNGVQAMKAGLFEIADLIVCNKNDLPGAEALVHVLEEAGALANGRPSVPVLSACARTGDGVARVVAAVESVWEALGAVGRAARRRRRWAAQVRRAVLLEVGRALEQVPLEDERPRGTAAARARRLLADLAAEWSAQRPNDGSSSG